MGDWRDNVWGTIPPDKVFQKLTIAEIKYILSGVPKFTFDDKDSEMAGQRSFILGHSTTSVLKWMGVHDFSVEAATRAVNKLASGLVPHNTIVTGLTDGKNPKYAKGMAELTLEQERQIYEAAGITSHKDQAFDPATVDDPEEDKDVEEVEESEFNKLAERVERLEDKSFTYMTRLDELEKRTPKKVHITIESSVKSVTLKEEVHPLFEEVMFHIKCGDNVMLVGPKGCGKTTLGEQIAKALERKFGTISLSGGVTESKLFGRITPNISTGKGEWHSTPFTDACEGGHVFLLDEVDNGDPNVLTSLNMVMANKRLVLDRPKNPIVKVHQDFICIAAANTWGSGADRHYVGRNQLDGAFIDRFVQIEMDYDENLERSLCPNHPELVDVMHFYRKRCRDNRLERVISTRFILRAYNWMIHGKDLAYVDKMLFGGWRKDEIAKVQGNTSSNVWGR